MDFINNWSRSITLGADATECPLDLPNGVYRLTISDGVGTAAKSWEIIDADVWDGDALLTRGLEGTTAKAWPAGSVIYCSLTAGGIRDLNRQIADLSSRLIRTQATIARIDQAANGGIVLVSELSTGSDAVYGYAKDGATSTGSAGAIAPEAASVIPGAPATPGADGELLYLLWRQISGLGYMTIRFRGTYESLDAVPFKTLTIDGQSFAVADAVFAGLVGGPETGLEFVAPSNPLTLDLHQIAFS